MFGSIPGSNVRTLLLFCYSFKIVANAWAKIIARLFCEHGGDESKPVGLTNAQDKNL